MPQKIKFSYAMNVLNGGKFIKYQLDSIYEHAHEIVIIEGAYQKFSFAVKNYRSTDDTIEQIKNYHDPLNKIKLVLKNKFYEDRKDMCNEFMPLLTGDVLWQIDVDEFYFSDTHKFVHTLFATKNDLDQISFKFYNYYLNNKWIIKGYDEDLLEVIRVNRIFKNMSWIDQRPPTLGICNKEIIPRKKLTGKELEENGHYMHNATMLFDQQVEEKLIFYNKKWPSAFYTSKSEWYKESWLDFNRIFSVSGFSNQLTYLLRATKPVPAEINLIYKKSSLGSSLNKLNKDKKIEEITSKKIYAKQIKLVRMINEIDKLNLKKGFLISINLILKIRFYKFKKDELFIYRVLIIKLIKNLLKNSKIARNIKTLLT